MKYKSKNEISPLYTIYGDTIWKVLFPHKCVPHHVWNNGEGKVIAITNGYNTTKEHVEKALQNGNISLSKKNELKRILFKIVLSGPLFSNSYFYRFFLLLPL